MKIKISLILKSVIFLLILFLLNQHQYSQIKRADNVRASLIKLIEYCVNDDYQNASIYFVYRGDDSARKWVDVYDYTNENDKKDVITLCKEVKDIVEKGGEFVFKKFTTKKESEGEWCVWQITFEKGDKKTAYFACLKIKGRYALGDID